MSVYGYDIDNHIAEVWSNMPNSIQYEDLVMYYNWSGRQEDMLFVDKVVTQAEVLQ